MLGESAKGGESVKGESLLTSLFSKAFYQFRDPPYTYKLS